MAIDARIPLSGVAPQMVNPEQLFSLRQLSLQAQDQQVARQRQQALQGIYSNPANIDSSTGMLSLSALSKMSQIDPNAALDIQKNQAVIGKDRAEINAKQQQSVEKQLAWGKDIDDKSLTFFNNLLDKKIPVDQAKNLASSYRANLFDEKIKSGEANTMGFTENQIGNFDRNFDLNKIAANAQTYQQYQAQKDKAATTTREDKSLVERTRHNKEMEKLSGIRGAPAPGISSLDSLDYLYQQYKIDPAGTMASLGAGPSGTKAKQALISYAAQQSRKEGGVGGADIAVQKQEFKAGGQALSQQEKKYAGIKAMEDKAVMQADLVEKNISAMGKGFDTPFFQKLLLSGKKATGDTAAAKYYNSVLSFQEEYAKVMTGSIGAAAATDSARKKSEELLDANTPSSVAKALLKQMKEEMGYTTASLQKSIDETRSGIRRGAGNHSSAGGKDFSHLWGK